MIICKDIEGESGTAAADVEEQGDGGWGEGAPGGWLLSAPPEGGDGLPLSQVGQQGENWSEDPLLLQSSISV